MKVLYIDCSMGAAGDMLTGALLELVENKEDFLAKVNRLGLKNTVISAEKSVKCGITGTHISVKIDGSEEDEHSHGHSHEHNHHSHEHKDSEHSHSHGEEHRHHHSCLADIETIINSLSVSQKVKSDAAAVYKLIAEAESVAHSKPVNDIHFHEVGTLDAIADIVSVCMLFEIISPDKTVVSPVHVGCGQVECAHGILPVPAPATAYILKDVPIYSANIKGELCTPTGAALLKHFADRFGDMPVMKTRAIGYGMGKKDFAAANCVRVMLGDTQTPRDTVTELECNVDDMTAEAIGFATAMLLQSGALEVFTVPVGMKKNRPGTLLCVICSEEKKDEIIRLIFKHTSTLGIREKICRRYRLDRKTETVQTPFGEIRKKISSGFGTEKEKFEYDDIARIAKEHNLSIEDVLKQIKK